MRKAWHYILIFHTVHLFSLYTQNHVCMCIFIGDELIADDDDKQQLLNYMIQVCRPRDWQISLLKDRLKERQLAISSSPRCYSQKRLDNVLSGGFNE